jgi:hypothetical protein
MYRTVCTKFHPNNVYAQTKIYFGKNVRTQWQKVKTIHEIFRLLKRPKLIHKIDPRSWRSRNVSAGTKSFPKLVSSAGPSLKVNNLGSIVGSLFYRFGATIGGIALL